MSRNGGQLKPSVKRTDGSRFSSVDSLASCQRSTLSWPYVVLCGKALKSLSKTSEEEAEYRRLPEGNKFNNYLQFLYQAKANKIRQKVKAADTKYNFDMSRIDDLQTCRIE